MKTLLKFRHGRLILAAAAAALAIGAGAAVYASQNNTATKVNVPVTRVAAPGGAGKNVPGLSNDKVQEGIRKAEQARQRAHGGAGGAQTGQSAADSSELLGSWTQLTGNLLNGDLNPPNGAQTLSVSANDNEVGVYAQSGAAS